MVGDDLELIASKSCRVDSNDTFDCTRSLIDKNGFELNQEDRNITLATSWHKNLPFKVLLSFFLVDQLTVIAQLREPLLQISKTAA